MTATNAQNTRASGLARFAALLPPGALVGLGLDPVDEPPAPPLPAAEDEGAEDLVAVNVARLRVALRVMGMPEDPKLAPVPMTGMVPLSGILVVATTTLCCAEVRERVVAAEVTDADEDLVTDAADADEDPVTERMVLESPPPLRLNSPV